MDRPRDHSSWPRDVSLPHDPPKGCDLATWPPEKDVTCPRDQISGRDELCWGRDEFFFWFDQFDRTWWIFFRTWWIDKYTHLEINTHFCVVKWKKSNRWTLFDRFLDFLRNVSPVFRFQNSLSTCTGCDTKIDFIFHFTLKIYDFRRFYPQKFHISNLDLIFGMYFS